MNLESPPFYVRFSLVLIILAIIAATLYLAKQVVIPLGFSFLFASLLLPVTNYLNRKGINRVISILLTLAVSFTIVIAIAYFLSMQIGTFLEDIPVLKKRVTEVTGIAHKWVKENLNIPIRDQKEYLEETTEQMNNGGGGIVQQTVITIKDVISYLVFLPVFTFLLLYHKEMIKRFLIEVFSRDEKDRIIDVLHETQSTTQQYVTGLLLQMTIVFALNATGFLLFGIKYPIFLALLSAMLNMVPYVGMLIANLFCMAVTLVSSENPSDVFKVFGVLMGAQVIDNNILMPLIVGTKLKLNAMSIIVGLLVGGLLCGVPGMFLAIPSLAILKVVFSHADGLKPWAMLLGDETTQKLEKRNALKTVFSKISDRKKARRAAKEKVKE
jgi:predicted PurR-regulated permease PerM